MGTQVRTPVGPDARARSRYSFFVSFVAAVGGFVWGYDLTIIAGAQIFLKKHFELSSTEFGFATSSAILGCIAGPTLGAYLCDRIGRKTVLIAASVLFAVSAIWTALPNSILMFNIFRIIGGLGVGLASLAAPMYIAEIAPAARRGRLGLMYQLAITVGALLATVTAWQLAVHLKEASWRWMFASELVPIVIFVILLLRVPQSPRWLAEKGRYDEAIAVFTQVDGAEHARREMEEIKASLNKESGSFSELFMPGLRLALLVGILLALFNNWTGWSGVAYYLPTIYQMGGYENAADAIGAALIPMTANLFLTFVAIWLVDRAGRRPLWIVTAGMMVISLTIMGMVFHLGIMGPIVIGVTMLILIPHAVGLGPLPWLMMSELHPTRIRARAVAITTTFIWIASFSGTLLFPKIVEISENTIGSSAGIFWMYGVLALLAFIFGLTLLPETKGRTLEQIAASWRKSDSTQKD